MEIKIEAAKKLKKLNGFWKGIHFCPTDAIEDDWGGHILRQASTDRAADFNRIFTMFEDIVSMDEHGTLIYDYTLTDLRFDMMIELGYELMVDFNFMPLCIASDKDCIGITGRYKGKEINVSEPTDYKLWQEICRHYTQHLVDRYGIERVSKWYFQCWNEPDHHFWLKDDGNDDFMKKQAVAYTKLYDHFVEGVCAVSDKIKVGGPSLSRSKKDFTDIFFNHIKNGTNYANGKTGTKFDFYGIHAYYMGGKNFADGLYPMVKAINDKIVILSDIAKSHGFDDIEVIVDEWDFTYGGFCGSDQYEEMSYRDSEYFAAMHGKLTDYIIKHNTQVSKMLICLYGQHNLVKDFCGYRNFFTLNRFPKPIYNQYVMEGKLLDTLIEAEYKENDTLSILPTCDDDGNIAIMAAYADDNFKNSIPDINTDINICGLNGTYNINIYKIDKNTCNSYRTWGELGSPYNPDQWQREVILQKSKFKPVEKFTNVEINNSWQIIQHMTQNSTLLIELTKA